MAGGLVGGSVGDAELADARFAGAGRPNWVEIRFDDDALTLECRPQAMRCSASAVGPRSAVSHCPGGGSWQRRQLVERF